MASEGKSHRKLGHEAETKAHWFAMGPDHPRRGAHINGTSPTLPHLLKARGRRIDSLERFLSLVKAGFAFSFQNYFEPRHERIDIGPLGSNVVLKTLGDPLTIVLRRSGCSPRSIARPPMAGR
jgi:hypothetical protein